LDKVGLKLLVDNLCVLVLSLARVDILHLIPKDILTVFTNFIASSVVQTSVDVPINWMDAFEKLKLLKFDGDFIIMKALVVLPDSNLGFHASAFCCDYFKRNIQWDSVVELLGVFWKKHQSLEQFSKILPKDANVLDEYSFGQFAKIIGMMACVEGQRYRIKQSDTIDISSFQFELECLHECSEGNYDYIFDLWSRLWETQLITDDTRVELLKSLYLILSHSPSLANVDLAVINNLLDGIHTSENPLIRSQESKIIERLLDVKLPINVLKNNWSKISDQLPKSLLLSQTIKESTMTLMVQLMQIHSDTCTNIFITLFKTMIHETLKKSITGYFASFELLKIEHNDYIKHISNISHFAISEFSSNRKIFQNISRILNFEIHDFIMLTLKYTLPYLIKMKNHELVNDLITNSKPDNIKVGERLIEFSGDIVCYLLINDGCLDYYVNFIKEMIPHGEVDLNAILCPLDLIVNLIFELGSEDTMTRQKVICGLIRHWMVLCLFMVVSTTEICKISY
jgi:hypothetical protein